MIGTLPSYNSIQKYLLKLAQSSRDRLSTQFSPFCKHWRREERQDSPRPLQASKKRRLHPRFDGVDDLLEQNRRRPTAPSTRQKTSEEHLQIQIEATRGKADSRSSERNGERKMMTMKFKLSLSHAIIRKLN